MSVLLELPKVELHLHLEGSMSVATVRRLAERHGADPSTVWPGGFPETFSFVDFPDFGRQFLFGLSLLRSAQDLAAIIDDMAATLAGQRVRYAEVTTTASSHFMAKDGLAGMTPQEYRDGLNEGRRLAAARGVDLSWVIDIARDIEPPSSTTTIDYLESGLTPDGLVAIGLGGYEVGFPAAPYRPIFERARALGLRSVPHAGETEGADSVRSAVEELGADRIGHGVRCLEDPSVVELLIERQIMLEVCPTSNVRIGVVPSLAEHPFPALRDAGLRVCLNTDDPGWFATDITTELGIATEAFGLSLDEHRHLQLDALAASFAPDATRAAVRAELEAWSPTD